MALILYIYTASCLFTALPNGTKNPIAAIVTDENDAGIMIAIITIHLQRQNKQTYRFLDNELGFGVTHTGSTVQTLHSVHKLQGQIQASQILTTSVTIALVFLFTVTIDAIAAF